LEYNDGWKFADLLYKLYIKYSGDTNIERIITFYKVYRAYVRGKVNSFMINDPYIAEEKKARAKSMAHRYFALALSYIKEADLE
jgi:hypothetical protein